jgi:Taurine catabolism dioxygenase TauD, TfdA family
LLIIVSTGHIVNAVGENEPTTVKAPPGLTNTALVGSSIIGTVDLYLLAGFQSFHTDNCEIMGLFCLEAAATGGESLIASSWNVYNELAAKRPDILSTLTGEWVLDT